MKLCPQCEFIYEDEQSFCDMDGTGLVHNPASELFISRLTIPLVADSGPTAQRSSSSIALATLAVIVLAGLVVAAYFARTRQSLARRSPEPAQSSLQVTDQATQSSAQSTADQLPSSATSDSEQASAAQPSDPTIASTSAASDQPEVDSTSSAAAKTALAHSRLNAGPVSASSGTGNSRGPVVVRLTNGAAIRADEAWEKREGIWYRQAGMVTFLKRSRVRAIERVAPSARAQLPAGNAAATNGGNQRAKKPVTRDQLRIAKLEPVKPKKDNRVTSFLKKTGNLIKKPFRF
jgi:hypothetical protein